MHADCVIAIYDNVDEFVAVVCDVSVVGGGVGVVDGFV